MESFNRTPNKNESRGDDIKLRAELKEALERELEKSPDKMDTNKIDSMISLLSRLQEDSAVVQEMPKDVYARKYLSGVIRYRDKRTRSMRATIFFIGIILSISICNWITVKATDKNLFHFVKEKAYLFYYETVGNRRESQGWQWSLCNTKDERKSHFNRSVFLRPLRGCANISSGRRGNSYCGSHL